MKNARQKLNKLYSFSWNKINKIHGYFYPLIVKYKNISFPLAIPRGGDFEKSINLYGCYEPLFTNEMIMMLNFDDIFFDIGSAFGYYSMLASTQVDSKNIYS